MQLFDAATSAGANREEADAGQTKPDFIAKMSICLKETKESRFWLRVILETIVRDDEGTALAKESNELVAIVTTIVKRAKENGQRGSGP